MTAPVPAPGDSAQSPDTTGVGVGTPSTEELADDPDRMARAITGKGEETVKAPTLELRQGTISAVNVPSARVDVALGGDETAIPGVAHLSNYRPKVGDTCWCLGNGPDLLVLDRAAALGPSVISDAGNALVSASESRSATSYGDLATVGPSLTTTISPSGRALVQVSCFVSIFASGGGGFMGCAVSGASTVAASDTRALYFFTDFNVSVSTASHSHGWSGSVNVNVNGSVFSGGNPSHGHGWSGTGSGSVSGSVGSGGAGSTTGSASGTFQSAASMVILYTGLNPGTTTFTAKYRANAATPSFSNRQIWVVPL